MLLLATVPPLVRVNQPSGNKIFYRLVAISVTQVQASVHQRQITEVNHRIHVVFK